MIATVRFGVLGALDVRRDGALLALGSSNQRRLLSALLVHVGEVVSVDHLADIVWSGNPPQSARASLKTYVSRLRALLGPDVIATRPPGYVLGASWIDAREFEQLLRDGAFEEAIALWRGRPFAEFADEEWARPSVVHLEELYAVARELNVEALLEASRVDDAVALAEALCASAPFRERAHGLLMLGLARQGRAAEALRAFDTFRRFLAQETGLEPSPALAEIQRAVLAQDTPVVVSGRVDALPGNLPVQHSSFVGRDREVTELAALLREARIVTLTGVGGVGKTRLALRVAADLLPGFRHGAWLGELARIRDPRVVVDAVAAVFGIGPGSEADRGETLAGFLRPREVLLVLDNCEHLLGAVVELVRALERTCPKLVVLATSREGLGIAGERIVALSPMDLPDSDDREAVLRSGAVRLFVDRAVAVKSEFNVTDANAGAIAEVVRRLDGIPLALELAAARVPLLSPAELARRLDDRFRLLVGGERGAIERHATLRAAIDWSYELLTRDQQRMLSRLSVFTGGCSLEAVEAVCSANGIEEAEVLDLLGALVARSLVLADDAPSGDRRYRLLETIRQYAEEQLDADGYDDLGRRHARFYATFVERAALGLRGPDQLLWLERAQPELENLRTAMAHAIASGDTTIAARFLWAAADVERGPIAGALWRNAEAVLNLPSIAAHERYSFTVLAGAMAALFRGSYERSEQLCAQALAVAEGPDDELEGRTAFVRAVLALYAGDQSHAVEFQERAVRHYRRVAEPAQLVRMLDVLVTMRVGGAVEADQAQARNEAKEALAAARGTGHPGLISCALAALAYTLASSEPQRSRALIAESLQINDSLGDIVVDELALSMTIVTCAMLGERPLVLRRSARAFDRGLSATSRHTTCLEAVAEAIAAEAPSEAAVLHGHIDAFAPSIAVAEPFRSFRERAVAAIEAELDADHAIQLRARGAALTQAEATVYARDVIARCLAVF